jgi:glycosyltransferase involved in cell wall biosynthesis
MNYPPNVEAMVYFIKNILPQIKRKVPDIKLTMAGKKAAPLLKNLAVDNKNITITGFVNDIRPFIGKANVYICPMVSGAGIKNKILEAWAMGKAIVATSLSCQAISEAKHNKNVLISDDPKGFSEFVVKLLKDEKLREKLGRNGRNLVKQKYNWPESAEKILGIIKKIQS